MNTFKDFLLDEDGATAIEYALIVGLVAVVIIVALSALGESVAELFGTLGEKIDDVAGQAESIGGGS